VAQNEQLASFCLQVIYFGFWCESFLSCFCFGIILLCYPLVAVVYEGLITLRFVFTSKGYQRKHKLCFEAGKNRRSRTIFLCAWRAKFTIFRTWIGDLNLRRAFLFCNWNNVFFDGSKKCYFSVQTSSYNKIALVKFCLWVIHCSFL